ncbi:MAG: energy transducer TonB [Pyrinomonadaceae bacterium]|jgi:TonB family protein|nr:energy transducer TonB [Pyrinomonadaceae bacterium]MDQ3174287.1 energy transducer TonB [Acidobacteriota bacterium]
MSSIEPKDPLFSEAELKRVLELWVAPGPSRKLDERVSNSYYREFGSDDAATQPVALPQSQKEVVTMKFCSTCQEEFAEKFSFCPVDGTPLNGFVPKDEESVTRAAAHDPEVVLPHEVAYAASAAGAAAGGAAGAIVAKAEYHLTFIDDAGLTHRLIEAVKEVAHESELTWPEFKRDPLGFTKRMAVGYGEAGWRGLSQPNVATGVLSALFLVMTVLLAVFWIDRVQTRRSAEQAAITEDQLVDQLIDIPSEQPTPDPGTAGLNKGSGGGSKPKQEKAGGGGGGGRQEQKEASFGKTPQASLTVPQIVAPDPKPPAIKNPSLPVAATVVADPLLVPPDARVLPYGDFKSKSTDPSSGPGSGNGIGTGRGGGIGPGDGGGIGPGRGGNIGGGDRNDGGGGAGGGGGGTDYNRVFSGKEVSSKARVLSKPEPQYTEEARKNQITGTVVLRAVFTSGGQVTNIRSVSGLPFGLTERAIAAARQIRFSPATKDGRPVSMYIQLEYNFNLY